MQQEIAEFTTNFGQALKIVVDKKLSTRYGEMFFKEGIQSGYSRRKRF